MKYGKINAPIYIAGMSPQIPGDTQSGCIRKGM